jgi:hypothetical protein
VDCAKLCEHGVRDYAAALGYARVALARAETEAPSEVRGLVCAALAHRARRLTRRLARATRVTRA